MPLLNASYLLSTLAWTRRFIGSFTVLQKPLKGLKGNKPKGKNMFEKNKNKMRKIVRRKKQLRQEPNLDHLCRMSTPVDLYSMLPTFK